MLRRFKRKPGERVLLIVQKGGLLSNTPHYVDVVTVAPGLDVQAKLVAPADAVRNAEAV